ncbi:MAG TPA: iron-sulfur cluster carrier protein ApbC [Gammaproteobacteria bacterium]|nr:iron-sulfur cluster carrier protein ApbC [Gammaproteobacteria bacterium]
MADVTRERVEAALQSYVEPYSGRDLVSAGAVRALDVAGDRVHLAVELGFPAARYRDILAVELGRHLQREAGVAAADIDIGWNIAVHAVQRNLRPMANVRNIVAVASGKGGVGKSTVAANLALALAAEGARVGVLDADIYGPSQPRMLGISGRPVSRDGKRIEPLANHGIVCMSIGFLIDEDQPMVWRGPMVTQALTQLLGDTDWPELDYLVVDMPPGTGDTQLTLAQRVPVSGAVIVTTPQDIALLDARKGLQMFRKVEVAVLGIVENMSTYVCAHCGHEEHIFGAEGGRRLAEQYGVPFLGALPLDRRIREQADGGRPTVVAEPDGPLARAYFEVARRTAAGLARAARDDGAKFPKIVIEE